MGHPRGDDAAEPCRLPAGGGTGAVLLQAARGFAALALGMAGLESLLLAPGKPPREPTNSLGAAAIVLFADQITDSARFLILAIALASEQPLAAGVGGAVGTGVALALGGGFARGLLGAGPVLRAIRRVAGLLLLLAGAVLVIRLRTAL